MNLKKMSFKKKQKVARDTTTPKDVLRELAKDDFWLIKGAVGQNPNTPEDVLEYLANAVNIEVKGCVARNPSTPNNVLLKLIVNEVYMIRTAVAHNPKVSSKMLIALFEYERSKETPGKYAIKNLYENPKLPYAIKIVIETLYGEML